VARDRRVGPIVVDQGDKVGITLTNGGSKAMNVTRHGSRGRRRPSHRSRPGAAQGGNAREGLHGDRRSRCHLAAIAKGELSRISSFETR